MTDDSKIENLMFDVRLGTITRRSLSDPTGCHNTSLTVWRGCGVYELDSRTRELEDADWEIQIFDSL